ncbi:MAG: tetratricopeptide repeat protein [Acidobacteria bacterium]|nr:tetratricopeptide repeat protein [Acidobacteriota bacterium]
MARLAAVVLIALLSACNARPDSPFLEIPHPSTQAMEPVVREQIATSRKALEEAMKRPDDEASLARAFGDLGLTYHAYDLTAPAAACYANARQLQPRETLWPYAEGRLRLEASGELSGAESDFRSVLELDSDDLSARLSLGRTLLDLRRPDEAAAEFRRVLDQDPESAAAYDGLGRTAVDDGDFEEAVGLFRKALELQPEASRVYYRLGQALRRAGRKEDAREALTHQGPTEVIFRDELQEALSRKARGVSAALRWGGVAMLAGDLDGATQAFRHALSLAPDDAATRHSLGGVLAQKGDLTSAIEQYRRAAELEPENATHPYNLGQLLLRTGQLDEAEAELRRALVLEPALTDAHLTLASIFEQRRDYVAALAEYDRVLAAEPANLQARTWRGVAFARMGENERALEELLELVEAAPTFPQARLQLGILLARLGRREEARRELQEVLSLDPPARVRDNARGALEALDGRPVALDGADLQTLKESAAARPGDAEAQRALAEALARSGDFGAAAAAYHAAVEAGRTDAPTRLAEATALVLAREYRQARSRLEEGLRHLPSDLGLRHALARLLAAAPDPAARDPRRSLELAQAVHRSLGTLDSAETLAMALAANGRFPDAARLQRQILDAAAALGNPALLGQLRTNLDRYQTGQPAANPFRK